MTVIATDGVELVTDGRIMANGYVVDDCNCKIIPIDEGEYEGGYYAAAGFEFDTYRVLAWLEGRGDSPELDEGAFVAMIVLPKSHRLYKRSKVWTLNHKLTLAKAYKLDAVGSGDTLAIIFMKEGYSAYESVKKVCKYMPGFCGGKITRMKIS